MRELDVQNHKVNKLMEFMVAYNKMGLFETKKILIPKYIVGMEEIFKNSWKNL